MLLAQEPKLLLVDEPVAGMTDAETEQTADLLREINRTRSVVVVEHDMEFVRALGVKVTVLHEGSRAVRGHDRPCQRRSRVVGGVSWPLTSAMLEVEHSTCTTAPRSRCAASRSRPAGRGHLPARPQRRRQDHLLRAIVGAHPVVLGPIRGRAQDITRLPIVRAGAARHRLGAAGPRHLPAADRAGEPGDRLRGAAARRSGRSPTRFSSCFRC